MKFITLFFGKWDIFCSSAWLIPNGGNIELVFGMLCTGRKLGRKLFREIIWMRTKTFQSTQLGVEIKCSKKKTIPSPFLCFIKIIYSAQVSVLNWYLVWSHGASQEVHGLEKQKFPLCDFFKTQGKLILYLIWNQTTFPLRKVKMLNINVYLVALQQMEEVWGNRGDSDCLEGGLDSG